MRRRIPGLPAASFVAVFSMCLITRAASAASLESLLSNQPQPVEYNVLHVEELAHLMKDPSAHAHIYDVNAADVRAEMGTIPGAELLPSYVYNTADELPAHKDAKLVFYCRNTRCMASHQAANRALNAGYTDVNVMVDGIEGWKMAGMPVDPAN